MVRAFDQKFRCKYFARFNNVIFDAEYPSMNEPVRWCYENMPEDRLWDYEYDKGKRIINAVGIPEQGWNVIFFFEIEEDLMAFKLVHG